MYSYIARQPILDHDCQLIGYELLYRNGENNAFPDVDSSFATQKLYVDQFLTYQNDVLSHGLGFVNFDQQSLLAGLPFDFPKDKYVIEVLENCIPNDELLETVIKLKQAGYTVALDDYVIDSAWLRFLSYIDIIKFDIRATPLEDIEPVLSEFSPYKVKFLAEKVETHQEYAKARALGFSYYQGYFFCKPEVVKKPTLDANFHTSMRLMKAVSCSKIDLDNVEQIIATSPSFSFRLLNYVNGNIAIRTPIKSFRQALLYLGEDKLRKFITYVCLTTSGDSKPSALFGNSLQRAKFIDLVYKQLTHDPDGIGYLTGLLSRIDAMVDCRMEDIIDSMMLDEKIKLALLQRKGILGGLLLLCDSLERSDWRRVEMVNRKLKLSDTLTLDAFSTSINWVKEILPH